MRLITFALSLVFCTSVLAANPQVEIKTNIGSIVVELDPEKAPKTVDNFLQYANDGFYKGTIFHRVIPSFMIQGGGFTADFKQKPTRPPIPNEAENGLKNEAGTIAMARTSDPQSATAQFFINVADNRFLNFTAPNPRGYGYAVFGRVVKGMDVVNKIAAGETRAGGPFSSDVPVKTVVIENIKEIK